MEILSLPNTAAQAAIVEVADTTHVFDNSTRTAARNVPGLRYKERFIPWGHDNRLPLRLRRLIGADEVTAQNKLFNVLCAYGAGPHIDGTDATRAAALLSHSNPQSFLLEQLTDLKYYYCALSVIILNRQGSQIVRIRHKEMAHVRLQEADRQGRIRHAYYADWDAPGGPQTVERLTLLDLNDPLADLQTRLGYALSADGTRRVRTAERKFAILLRFPTPGAQYYPVPYYAAMFLGGSYDEKRLIAATKRAKMRNHASVKYQIEVNRDYWQNLIAEERINDPLAAQERIKREKENIRDFVAGVHNSGKAWITGYYVDPQGHEVRDIRVVNIEGAKEGGDYADETNVAANTLCYADNVHPSLVGAVPGKSSNTASGSDKRELYTMKQALETAWKDIALQPLRLMLQYNGLSANISLPIIQLTTLDEHKDYSTKTTQQQ